RAGQRQVGVWRRTNAPILHKRELDPPKAVHVTALAEERHQEAPAELAAFRCNSLVRAAEHVLGLHARTTLVAPFSASCHCQASKTLAIAGLRARQSLGERAEQTPRCEGSALSRSE